MTITQSSLSNDPSKFWQYVNSKKKICGIPSNMRLNESMSNDTKSTCELFATFFKSVYIDNDSTTLSGSSISEYPILDKIQFSADEILSSLIKLDPKKGSGPDNIAPLLLISCAIKVYQCH